MLYYNLQLNSVICIPLLENFYLSFLCQIRPPSLPLCMAHTIQTDSGGNFRHFSDLASNFEEKHLNVQVWYFLMSPRDWTDWTFIINWACIGFNGQSVSQTRRRTFSNFPPTIKILWTDPLMMYLIKECSHRGISCTRKSGKRWFDSKYFLQLKVRMNINIKYLLYI